MSNKIDEMSKTVIEKKILKVKTTKKPFAFRLNQNLQSGSKL